MIVMKQQRKPSLLEGKGCFYELALPLKDEDKSILVSLDYNYTKSAYNLIRQATWTDYC